MFLRGNFVLQRCHPHKLVSALFYTLFLDFPDLLFLAFLQNGKENHKKKRGFPMLAEPLKSLGKKGKTLKIARTSFKRKKARKSKQATKSAHIKYDAGLPNEQKPIIQKSHNTVLYHFIIAECKLTQSAFCTLIWSRSRYFRY